MSTPPSEAIGLISPYVTNLDRPVFVLKNLPEEVVAVLFAYYSRSRDDLRTNLLRLIRDQDLALHEGREGIQVPDADLTRAREKARQFHEKWVVGYGHASVAEHAVAHVAIEKISILASKVIEDARLASYTEKSTRYVQFNPQDFYTLDELPDAERALAKDVICSLFDSYTHLFDPLTERIQQVTPRAEGQSEAGWLSACKAQTCDILRYLLPAATHTNIGMTANARTLEHLITKMLSHPLAEVRQAGASIKTEAQHAIPTLIKYAAPQPYLQETPVAISERLRDLPQQVTVPAADVSLVSWPDDAEERLAAAMVYEATSLSMQEAAAEARNRGSAWQRGIIEEGLKRRGSHDAPLRVLEHLYYTYDIVVDFGAFRDIQRHRMATQTAQRLTPDYGYDVPPPLERFGFQEQFIACMEQARRGYERLALLFPNEAQYLLPLAYRKRCLFTWNLRELHHFISLRSAKQGHVSYRSVAQQVFKELERVHPFLASFVRVDMTDYRMARE